MFVGKEYFCVKTWNVYAVDRCLSVRKLIFSNSQKPFKYCAMHYLWDKSGLSYKGQRPMTKWDNQYENSLNLFRSKNIALYGNKRKTVANKRFIFIQKKNGKHLVHMHAKWQFCYLINYLYPFLGFRSISKSNISF